MEIEKAIQFLTDNAAAHDARLTAIESHLLTLVTVVKSLADTMAESQKATAKAMDEMRQEMRRLDVESRERDKKLDERIANLVSAVGALVNNRPQ